jgi:hypothetical protein
MGELSMSQQDELIKQIFDWVGLVS